VRAGGGFAHLDKVWYNLIVRAVDLTPGESKPEVKAPKQGRQSDALWKKLRIIEATIQSHDVSISTLRRDVNRVDRKQYREAEEKQPSTEAAEPIKTKLNPLLFGGV